MNKIIILGRLVKDRELKTTLDGEKTYTRFVMAVERNFKSKDGTIKADFIPIIVWGKKAEIICKYLTKGSLLSVSGRLSAYGYEDANGTRKYVAEVVADDFKFINIGNKNHSTEEAL